MVIMTMVVIYHHPDSHPLVDQRTVNLYNHNTNHNLNRSLIILTGLFPVHEIKPIDHRSVLIRQISGHLVVNRKE